VTEMPSRFGGDFPLDPELEEQLGEMDKEEPW